MMIFKVLRPGLYTTVQDTGRYGYQSEGVVVSGAMDIFACKTGNILLGNDPDSASLEITMSGPKLQAMEDTVICITGADITPMIDDRKIGVWKTVQIKKNQVLSFGAPKNGIRAYISVSGGFKVTEILKSSSTYVKGKLGGYKGRTLKENDNLNCNPQKKSKIGIGLALDAIPEYAADELIRVIIGPDDKCFTKRSYDIFFESEYKITNAADRMGYRLEGQALKHKKKADIISDTINFGTIQVPKNGKPIILMSDHQTTGGYTRIANVISVDLPLIAQRYPGQTIRFEEVSIERAQELYKQQLAYLEFLNIWINK